MKVHWPGVGVVYLGAKAVYFQCRGSGEDDDVRSLPAWFQGFVLMSLDEYPVTGLKAVWLWRGISLIQGFQPYPSVYVNTLQGLERTNKPIIICIKSINSLHS